MSESLEQSNMFRLVFRMPLHCHDEAFIVPFHRFNHSIAGVTCRNDQPFANTVNGLMMP